MEELLSTPEVSSAVGHARRFGARVCRGRARRVARRAWCANPLGGLAQPLNSCVGVVSSAAMRAGPA
eukprot:6784466-Alexandrium_andersonii.AAC.1